MTIWADADRVTKIQRELKEIRRSVGIIERILRHMGTKPPGNPLTPLETSKNKVSRPGWGVSGEGDAGDGDEQEGR